MAFAQVTMDGPAFDRANPSGYVENQGAFAQRFAAEVGPRLALDAKVVLLEQTDFSEPLVRTNTQPVNGAGLGWAEAPPWDEIAAFYRHSS